MGDSHRCIQSADMEARHYYYYDSNNNDSVEDECRVVLNDADEYGRGAYCGHYKENGKGLSLTLGNSSGVFSPDHNQLETNNTNTSSNDHNDQSCSQSSCHLLLPTRPVSWQLPRKSQYMKPAQQLLDEVVCVSNAAEFIYDHPFKQVVESNSTTSTTTTTTHHHPSKFILNNLDGEESSSIHINAAAYPNSAYENHHHHLHDTVSKLVALLRQVERRYEKYLHEMETVVSSFEAVSGVGAAAAYTALTIQAMSKHFSNLRHAIVAQIKAASSSRSHPNLSKQHHLSPKSRGQQKRDETLSQLQAGIITSSPQFWRPLRGLPEHSVSVLRAWLFQHFLHPYPNDDEKLTLASQTGLTRNQISNWFINARVRLWKPMIEDMYREEFGEDIQD